MILVAGGTGRLGRLVVGRLATAGLQVRVLTRTASRADGLRGPNVGIVVGDVRDPPSLEPAFAGVRTVVSAVHGFVGTGGVTPASVDRDGNASLVAAAKIAGAAVVLVSVVGARSDHPMELARMKAAAEENLRASGVGWTIVRAGPFLELYLDLMRDSAKKSGRPMVFGRGDNPIDFVSVTAVADVVADAARRPSPQREILEIRGPARRTLNDLAADVQGELGGSAPPRHIPRAALRLVAASGRLLDSKVARLSGQALILDTADITAGPRPLG